jgi:hypothetical protein
MEHFESRASREPPQTSTKATEGTRSLNTAGQNWRSGLVAFWLCGGHSEHNPIFEFCPDWRSFNQNQRKTSLRFVKVFPPRWLVSSFPVIHKRQTVIKIEPLVNYPRNKNKPLNAPNHEEA